MTATPVFAVSRPADIVLSAPAGLLWPKGARQVTYMSLADARYDTSYDGIWACGECGVIGHGTSGREILQGRWKDAFSEKHELEPHRADIYYTHVTCDVCIALRTTVATDTAGPVVVGDVLRSAAHIAANKQIRKHGPIDVRKWAGIVYAMLAVHEHRVNKPQVPIAFERADIFINTYAMGDDPYAATLLQNAAVAKTYETGSMAGVEWWTHPQWKQSVSDPNLAHAINRWCVLTDTPPLVWNR